MTAGEQRPDPDRLLAELKATSGKPRRGRLTIFLGMCAGVGKTYAMLKAARSLQQQGIEPLVGVVETHGRTETAALLEGLVALPLREISYHGTMLREMDLDGILEAKPRLVLVDELAHSNVPGSRHPKRYQDVFELLDAGIDVLTTLNVQHIESRVDVIQGIAGIAVRETVPDMVVDAADEIRLIDLTPEILRIRLSEGKVYLADRAATAAENFFREENLVALREMALRVTAEHVGQGLRNAMTARNIAGPWRSGERLMVAVGPSPFSEHLVRYTRRMAAALDAPWVAAYVESAESLDTSSRERLSRNLSLARQLGAEVIWTAGEDLAGALLEEARARNVTQIIVGKPMGSAWSRWRRGAALRKLLRQSGEIDICVVRAGGEEPPSHHAPASQASSATSPGLLQAGLGIGIILAFTALFWFIQSWTGYWAIALLYLALVVFLASRFSLAATMAIAASSALLWNFLFIPPLYTFRIHRFQDGLMFAMYFLVALAVGGTTSRLKWRERAERRLRERTRALYRLSRSVIGSRTMEEGLAIALEEIAQVFGADAAIFLAGDNGRLEEQPIAAGAWKPGEKEFGVASWVFTNRRPAGRATDTLPESEGLYIPLMTDQSVVGVLGVHRAAAASWSFDERDLLAAVADLLAALVERDALMRRSGLLRLADESERLYKTLFSSVSHELKTPIAVIAAHVAAMKANPAAPDQAQRVADLDASTRRLQHVVENLLNISRIEAGRLQPESAWCEVDGIIESARRHVDEQLTQHRFIVSLEETAQVAVRLDAAFVECALTNLLVNAAQHSPAGSTITVTASVQDDKLNLVVTDEGDGIPPAILPRVFEKFVRGDPQKSGGTGLGLAIVQGLAQAMGGAVSARNRKTGGAEFRVTIPVETAKVSE